MTYKLVILVRNDLNMSTGKIVAQTAHAVVDATLKSYSGTTHFWKWKSNGETIIALKVKNEKTLLTIMDIANRKHVPHGYIVDEGRTQVTPDTITVGFVGPDNEEKINKLVGQLKLL